MCSKQRVPVRNLISVEIKLFCEGLRDLLSQVRFIYIALFSNKALNQHKRTTKNIKNKGHSRHVREKALERFKAGLSYKTITQPSNIPQSFKIQYPLSKNQPKQDN
ncbi:hypothetical protein ILYODFUR_023118 [Ilyodon furcidens]|uniref:Uncharacterized protein n=1 Tax=Ilyodon furcidens TaxID=33524 RepID=A0ABV0U7P8_9TELE